MKKSIQFIFLLVIILEISVISILIYQISGVRKNLDVTGSPNIELPLLVAEATKNNFIESNQKVNHPELKETNFLEIKTKQTDDKVKMKETNMKENLDREINISVTGDLMVHSWQLENAFNRKTQNYDFNHSFEYIKGYFLNSDLAVANLETVFGGLEAKISEYPMFNTPDEFGIAIKNAGFDLLTTANNHSNDRKKSGVLRTIKILDELAIEHFGTYSSKESRDNIFIKEVNDIKIAFLSYTYGTNGIAMPKGEDYLINILNEDLIKSDLARAKALSPDLIIVMPHMGNEYETEPNSIFKNWAHFMIENGADIVLASHPHVLQRTEFVEKTMEDGSTKNCFIAYSLGNFVSSQRTTPRDAGVIINLNIKKENGKTYLRNVYYVPTWVKFVDKNGQYDITVLPVTDTLKKYFNGISVDLRDKDINRLKEVHFEAGRTFLNKEIPFEEMQDRYEIVKNSSNTVYIK